MANPLQKTIAVAIPTYRREKELIRLLQTIAVQRCLPENLNFEILVVNNNPVSYWDRVVAALPDLPFAMHCIDVGPRGFANVRNAAVAWVLARHVDAMIFVDDDEVVPPGWLAAMVRAWEKHQGDIITGPVLQLAPPAVPHLVKKLHLLEANHTVASGKKLAYANSNNTLVSRRVLEVMGPAFHPALNRSGGEDILFFHQCHLRGFGIYWDNAVMIGEPTPPERTTMTYVLRRRFNHGATRVAINKVLFPDRWRAESFKLLRNLSAYVLKSIPASAIRRDHRRFGQALCRLAWVAGLGACLLGGQRTRTIYN